MPGNDRLSGELAAQLDLEHGAATVRHFPDGESDVRIDTPVEGRRAIIVCTLDRPDDKLVPLQWVSDVARRADAPFVVLAKTRRSDRDVTVSVPEVDRWRLHTPVLVDDIVSSAHTMIETVGHLRRAGLGAPVCVAVHAVFAQTAYEDLRAAGVAQIVSCNTIEHPSNRIALAPAIAVSVREYLP